MSNSSLICYTKISPNKTSPRTHTIDTITIHCVVGQCSVETLGAVFAPSSKQASSNYGIGSDGRIGMYVEEKDRSWCSSNAANDHRAITIEVASDTTSPYAVTAKAYASLIKLCADICHRNGIKKLVWSTDKNTRVNHLNGCNMTAHRDFANKSCPGDYLYSREGEIAEKVNALLAGDSVDYTTSNSTSEVLSNGCSGSAVKTLQENLIKLGYSCGTSGADGDYGDDTELAVKTFQAANGLEADGEAGPITLAKIKSLLSSSSTTSTSSSTTTTASTTTTTTTTSSGGVCTVAQMLSAAEYWVGYKEKASSSYASTRDKDAFTKNAGSNNYTYAGYLCGAQGQSWCAAQVSTFAYEACGNSKTAAKTLLHGVWPYLCVTQVYDAAPSSYKGRRSSWTPAPGDIIIFDYEQDGYRDHTGLVIAVTSSQITTIEGNSSNSCKKNTYSRSYSGIWGYVRPKYTGGSTTTTTTTTSSSSSSSTILKNGSSGTDVYTLQQNLIKLGYDCGTIDGDFGDNTEKAVKAFQKANGLEDDGEVGPLTQAKITSLLSSSSTTTTATTSQTLTTTANLNVRKGAGTNYGVITTLKKGTSVSYSGEYSTVNSVKWYKVSYTKNGSTGTGYVCSTYLT